MTGTSEPTPRLETAHYVLRPLTLQDATPRYLGWLHDAEITRTLEVDGPNQTLQTIRDYIASHDGTQKFLFGIFTKDGLHIGTHSFRWHPEERYATVGVMIGDRDHWGRAVPLETRARILEWAFGELGCDRVQAGCFSVNTPAIYNFRKQKWRLTGITKGFAVIDGRNADMLHFAINRNDWHA